MKKSLIFILIFILFSFPATAQDNWEKQYTLDNLYVGSKANADLWETIDNANRINTALVYSEVKIGQPILISYSRYGENAEISDYNKNEHFKKENQKFYPTGSYIKVIYMGQDNQENIKLKVYDHYRSYKKEMYKEINSIIEDEHFLENRDSEAIMARANIENKEKLKEVLIKMITINGGYYIFNFDEDKSLGENYTLTSAKTITFGNNLIPPFKVITNRNDSTIEIMVAN